MDSDALLSKISNAVKYKASGAQRLASKALNSSNEISPSFEVSAALASK
jgi:hypothetical protein